MSIETALKFMECARCDAKIQKQVLALRGAQALQDMVAIAAAHGFEFTEEDYRAAVVASADGELSDEALDELAREMHPEA